MQYDRQEDGTLVPLPKKNIDTGMGLERIAAILQGVHSNFETDVLKRLMDVAEQITGSTYGGSDERTDTSLRILADHARAITFLIADGVMPSNEGRGYVLRRILRRAVRHGRIHGVTEPFLGRLIDEVVDLMGAAYPEIVEHRDFIKRIVLSEEQRFGATLKQGLAILEAEILRTQQNESRALDGSVAFMLHDTYGFPIELTAEIAAEAGLTVDVTAFEAAMAQQRDRARAAVKDDSWSAFGNAFAEIASRVGEVEFTGYACDEGEADIVGIVVDGLPVERLEPGQAGEVVLSATPFYGEQGGQVGDTGVITAYDTIFTVADTKIPLKGIVSHSGSLDAASAGLQVGQRVHASIDHLRRERIRRNHTATHLLHWALGLVLGEHVHQSGSHVAPDRMRFDFTHFEAPTPEQLAKVERLVNAKIMEDHPVRAFETSLASAREAGVTALFGEKYGEYVRVLEIGNFSKELCGGTHVGRTTEIGLLKIVSEGSVGANLRRIEAVTSFDALEAVRGEEAILAAAAATLKCRPAEVAEKTEALAKRLKDAEKALADAKRRGGSGSLDTLVSGAADAGYPVVVARLEAADAGELRELSDALRAKLGGQGAVVLAAAAGGRALLLAAGSEAAVSAGFDAGGLLRAMAPLVGGRGGGKPAMAQGGGEDASGIDSALVAARDLLGIG
jgi:alanyl-tRNA synthetase